MVESIRIKVGQNDTSFYCSFGTLPCGPLGSANTMSPVSAPAMWNQKNSWLKNEKKSKTKSNTWQKISKGHRRVTGRAVGVRDPRERGWQQYFCLAHWEEIFVFAKKEIAVNMYRYRTLLSFIANFIRIFSLRCYGNETLPTSFHLRIDGNSFPELKNDKWKNEICDGNPRG